MKNETTDFFNRGVEESAKVVDKFTNPLILSSKLPWLDSPLTFARIMKEISAAIRELKEPV